MSENNPSTPRQLKNILINPRFQLKLMSYFVGLFFLTTICLYSTTFLFFWKLKQKAFDVGIPDGHIFYRFLINQKNDLDNLFIGLAILNFFLLLGVGFLISHRIAGPIFKLKNQLSKIETDPGDFKLRESDFFRELEPLVKNLKDKIK
jgi:hypothetical protein